MATAGDVPTFRPGIQNPAADLNDLARRVGMLEATRYAAPLQHQLTPAGPLVSLFGVDDVLCRLITPADPIPPEDPVTGVHPNKWSWVEVYVKDDGTTV